MNDAAVVILIWILCGLVGGAIGSYKDRVADGFLYGVFLGPIGWMLIGVGPVPTAIVIAIGLGVLWGFVRQSQDEYDRAQRAEQARMAATPFPTDFGDGSPVMPSSPAPTPSEPTYLLWVGGKNVGPVTLPRLRAMLAAGQVRPETPLVGGGNMEWRTVKDVAAQ